MKVVRLGVLLGVFALSACRSRQEPLSLTAIDVWIGQLHESIRPLSEDDIRREGAADGALGTSQFDKEHPEIRAARAALRAMHVRIEDPATLVQFQRRIGELQALDASTDPRSDWPILGVLDLYEGTARRTFGIQGSCRWIRDEQHRKYFLDGQLLALLAWRVSEEDAKEDAYRRMPCLWMGKGSAEPEPEPSLRLKTMGYELECLNQSATKALDIEKHYYSWAPKDQPPSEKTKDIKGILSIYFGSGDCANAVARYNALPPKEPELEQLGTRLATAMQNLQPILIDARYYYENRDYERDKFSKARNLHQKLVEAFDEFDAAKTGLGDETDRLEEQEDQRMLADVEKSVGHTIPYLTRATMVRAGKVRDAVIRPWDKLQLPLISRRLSHLEAAVKEMIEYRNAHFDGVDYAGVQNFIQESEEVVHLTRNFMRRVENNQPFSHAELDFAEESPRWIERRYHTMAQCFTKLWVQRPGSDIPIP